MSRRVRKGCREEWEREGEDRTIPKRWKVRGTRCSAPDHYTEGGRRPSVDITKVRDPKRTAYPPFREEDLYSGQGGKMI